MAHRNPNGEPPGARLSTTWAHGGSSDPLVDEIAKAVQSRMEPAGRRRGTNSGVRQWSMILGLVAVILMLASQVWGWGVASGELATKETVRQVAEEAREHSNAKVEKLDKRVDNLEKSLIGIRKDIGIIAEEIQRSRVGGSNPR